MAKPLVLEWATRLPLPSTGALLQELGFQVLKLDLKETKDSLKDLSISWYQATNQKKKILCLSLHKLTDQKKILSILKKASVFLDGRNSYEKKESKSWFEGELKKNKKLVHASMVGFPKNHPSSNFPSHDLNLQAESGLLSLTPSGTLPVLPWSEILGSRDLCNKILMALFIGKKTKIEHSIFESLIRSQKNWIKEFESKKNLPSYGKTLITGKYPSYRVYKTKDKKVLWVACLEKKYWVRFLENLSFSEKEIKDLEDSSMSTSMSAHQKIEKKVSLFKARQLETRNQKNPSCMSFTKEYSEIDFGKF